MNLAGLVEANQSSDNGVTPVSVWLWGSILLGGKGRCSGTSFTY